MHDSRTRKKISQGLCEAEITTARFAHGDNVLTPPQRKPWLKRYFARLSNPIIKILLAAACLSIVVDFFQGQYAETIGIFCAVFAATAISLRFEDKATRRFERIASTGNNNSVKVVRRGSVCEIARRQVVVGEIVLLEPGDEIPADGTLLEAYSLTVDESALSGNIAVKKSATPGDDSRVLRSTFVVEGNATMQVMAVGDQTEAGKLAREAHEFTPEDTPLNRQIRRIAAVISRLSFIVALAAFLILTAKQLNGINYNDSENWIKVPDILLRNFMMSVALVVMSIPDGLPTIVALALALNIRRMNKSGAVVKNTHACETMGAVTTICTDMAGIITQNTLHVTDIKHYGTKHDLCTAIAVNSTAHLNPQNKYHGIGNAMECALLQWMEKEGEDYRALRGEATVAGRIPFTPQRRYMATIADTAAGRYLFVKGAPEAVRGMCDIAAGQPDDFGELLESFRRKALHPIVFARKRLETGDSDIDSIVAAGGMKYMGMAALGDPLRPDIPETVALCRRAGIKVRIVTGDDSATAFEVARQAGIWTDADDRENALTGRQFAMLSDEEALHRIPKLKILSQASADDRQRLVKLMQNLGEVVAQAGSGGGDISAIESADVGIATTAASAAAKQKADIELTEDSLSTVVTAVKWGRSIYHDIQRFIVFMLTVNITAMLTVLGGVIIGTEIPLTVTQMLWLNLVMDIFATLALTTLPPSERVMARKPLKLTSRAMTKPMLRNIAATALAFTAILLAMLAAAEWQIELHAGDETFRVKKLTIFFTVFVFLNFWNLFNIRAFGSYNFAFHKFFKCYGMLMAIVSILTIQALIVEFGETAFRTTHLNFRIWVRIFCATSLAYIIPEAVRAMRRRAKARNMKGKNNVKKQH